jgi:hypothetical protein
MTGNETEIRRHANGSIDIDHYIRHCHRQRSLSAHAAIRRVAKAIAALVARLLVRDGNAAVPKANDRTDEQTHGPDTREDMRKAA